MNQKVILITKDCSFAAESRFRDNVAESIKKLKAFSPVNIRDYMRLRTIHKNINVVGKIDKHIYDIFDLLNYLMNDRKYVYKPEDGKNYYQPGRQKYLTGIYLMDFLQKHG